MQTKKEKNADVVKLASYAPLFNRIGHSQWTPDLIWFNQDSVILTPNYWVQKIFSDYSGTKSLNLEGQDKKLRESKLYISAVSDDENKIILKIVNSSENEQILNLFDEKNQKITAPCCEKILLQAANGKAKPLIQTDAVSKNPNNKALPGDSVTNLQMCKLRFPEESSYKVTNFELDGKILLPPKTVTVLKF